MAHLGCEEEQTAVMLRFGSADEVDFAPLLGSVRSLPAKSLKPKFETSFDGH